MPPKAPIEPLWLSQKTVSQQLPDQALQLFHGFVAGPERALARGAGRFVKARVRPSFLVLTGPLKNVTSKSKLIISFSVSPFLHHSVGIKATLAKHKTKQL